MILYDFPLSGNCYKVRLLLAQLQLPYEKVFLDRLAGETRKSDYLEKNPNGKVPLLELESGEKIAESNAILFHLAEGTPFSPAGKLEKTQVLQWLFFEQASHMPNIAVPRYWISVLKKEKEFAEQLVEKHKLGYQALAVMEKHLQPRKFFVNETYSIADISLYAYTHMAHEGKFEMDQFPSVLTWLKRVQDQPNHITIV